MLTGSKQHAPTRFWFYPESEICLHDFRYPSRRLDYLPHTHDEYNIVVCLRGRFEYSLRQRCETLEAGDVLVINPGELHHGRHGCNSADSTGLTLHVTERAMNKMMQGMRVPVDVERNSVSFLGKVNDPNLMSLSLELLNELERRQHGYEMVAQALVVQLMVHLLRNCLAPTVFSPRRVLPRQLPSWQMVRTLEYMNARGKSNFSLSELCSDVGTSSTRFIQLFKNSVAGGMSPHTFYNHLMVKKAKRLLLDPACSVKAVSFELGFQNESHFGKVFRSCTGLTPGSFRMLEPGAEADFEF